MMPGSLPEHDLPPAPLGLHLGCTLGEMFVRAVERNGDLVAVSDETESLTYREFGIRVARFAETFRAAGLRRGQALAQLSVNKVDAVCTIAAAFLLGLRYTPLHPLGSEPDQAFILNDAQIDCLVADEGTFTDRAQRLVAQMPRKLIAFSHGNGKFGVSLPGPEELAAAGPLKCDSMPEDIALIAYTGGTTGRPKGVAHRHRSLVANLLIAMAEWDWGEPRRFLAVTPISHAAFLFILPVLLRGGTFFMLSSFSVQGFASTIRSNSITTTFLVPTMIYSLLDQQVNVDDLNSLQSIIYGAAPISPPRLRDAIQRIGPKFCQLYGQTEAPNSVTMLFKRDHTFANPERLASCGVPLTGNEVRLLDPRGQEVPTGDVGEICLRGPLVMDGYWRRPQETAETLSGGWLHTGDIARRDADGFLYIVDRKKDVIISGGFNVYPSEVEEALAHHPAVAQSCVVGVPDTKWGEAVAAFVVIKSGWAMEQGEIQEHVKRQKGPVYTPKHVHFVERLPLTSLGKVDRNSIRAEFWRGAARNVN